MPRLIDCGEQGSAEWLAARAGKITASRIKDVLAFSTAKGRENVELKARADYRIEVVSERLTGLAVEKFVTAAMRNGTEQEPNALIEYEVANDCLLERPSFCLHPTMDYSGASADGLVGDDGGVEAKCPTRTTHIEWMLAGVIPPEHEPQVVWNMVCYQRNWWDFISYCGDFPEPLNRFMVRLYRKEDRVAEITAAVRKFNDEVEDVIAQLTGNHSKRLNDKLRASIALVGA